jgi:nifR3 family TIM-barrel protein
MANVTDAAFRQMFVQHSRPGLQVIWTEFVSADGLCSPGREVLKRDLAFTAGERPIVAQLFTSHPEKMFEAAKLVVELGFDGLDINMGCPDRSVEKQGAGAAMIKNPEQARAVIRAALAGVAGAIPVSVKTRVGYNTVSINEWIPALLAEPIAALTIHARTRKEMSDVPARWEHVAEVVALRDRLSPHTKIIGNGDVTSYEDGLAKAAASGADGIMVGRGIFGNPWFFNEASPFRHPADVAVARGLCTEVEYVQARLQALLEHTRLFLQELGDIKSFAIMKKHYKAYVHGWAGSKELRMALMEANDMADIERLVKEYLQKSYNIVI